MIKNPKRIDLDRIAQYLASMSDETILDAVRRKTDLFDKSYKTCFPRGLSPEKVFLAWLIAQEVEAERSSLLAATTDPDDLVMKTILGIHGTPWGIYVANTLIERTGSDMSKMTLQKMNTEEFKNAIKKYARKAMELYSEIAVNIVSSSGQDSSTRNEIRIRPFLEKMKRTLTLRLAKAASWKLPKLHTVSTAK